MFTLNELIEEAKKGTDVKSVLHSSVQNGTINFIEYLKLLKEYEDYESKLLEKHWKEFNEKFKWHI